MRSLLARNRRALGAVVLAAVVGSAGGMVALSGAAAPAAQRAAATGPSADCAFCWD